MDDDLGLFCALMYAVPIGLAMWVVIFSALGWV